MENRVKCIIFLIMQIKLHKSNIITILLSTREVEYTQSPHLKTICCLKQPKAISKVNAESQEQKHHN